MSVFQSIFRQVGSDNSESRNDSADLDFILRLTSFSYIITLALTWKVYVRVDRLFAPAPVVHSLLSVPYSVDIPLFGSMLALLVVLIVKPRLHAAAYAVAGIGTFWALQDLLRLQPYTMMYIFTIFISAFSRQMRHHGLSALRVMVSSVYFWAGFNKLNASFIITIFPWFVLPIYQPFSALPGAGFIFILLGILTPLFELAIGILLLIPVYRKTACVMALFMLAIVLCCLGPVGWNWNNVVWPWNIYLLITEYILFIRLRAGEPAIHRSPNLSLISSIAIFSLAPALALFGLWHAYPSFRLYSGNTRSAVISLPENEPRSELPEHLADLIQSDGRLDVTDFAVRDLNMAVYPEDYVFRMGARGLCRYLHFPSKARLRLTDIPDFLRRTAPASKDEPLCLSNGPDPESPNQ